MYRPKPMTFPAPFQKPAIIVPAVFPDSLRNSTMVPTGQTHEQNIRPKRMVPIATATKRIRLIPEVAHRKAWLFR